VPICQSEREYWVLWKDFSSRIYQSEFPSPFLSLGTGAWAGAPVSDVVGWGALSDVWSYCRKYCLPECVPTGYDVEGCTVKASFSPTELLRKVTVTESSSVARKTTLYDLPLSLGLLVSHCSSWTISGWTHIISPDFIVIGMRPLAFYCSAIGLMTSNLTLEIGTNLSWTVIFRNIPKLRVTILAVTFFCSDLRVKTLASTEA